MSTISWSEIRHRALQFAHEWSDAKGEASEKQTFWNEFFEIFGIRRRTVAAFEQPLKNTRGKFGFLDLFWPGVVLVEHKSAGTSLRKAELQAFEYIRDLIRAGRQSDIPRYVIVSDFKRFGIFDLEPDESEPGAQYRYSEVPLAKLHEEIRQFAFMTGDKPRRIDPEDPANFEATALLCELHDSLRDAGYSGVALERFLVRILFCLFAEDTFIFEPRSFTNLIERTKPDGSDLGMFLAHFFEVLDTPTKARQRNLDEELAAFEYVNGTLFKERLPIAAFTSAQRDKLLKCAYFHWARISPAVFGSLFQDVLEKPERRQLGAHYTSERDVMKVLRSLFIDDLEKELESIKADRSTRRTARMREFQAKLRNIRVFDPACGCGNFLILAYRELRRIEQELLLELRRDEPQTFLDIREVVKVDVDQFFGIELNEWTCRIAEVGLWLADHQANRALSSAFGQALKRLPLRAAPTIRNANALREDWRDFLPPSGQVFVVGNPPFVGKKEQTKTQKEDMQEVFVDDKGRFIKGAGVLDYVCAWYVKAVEYIQATRIRCAFVSTSSITQGEQPGILFRTLFERGLHIHFAHRTFAWESEARGKAHVHCIILGFGLFPPDGKPVLYEYDDPKDDSPRQVRVKQINEYLVEGAPVLLSDRSEAVGGAPSKVSYGSFALDGGFYTLTRADRNEILAESPEAKPYIRPFIGGEELLHGKERWCLWLLNAAPSDIRDIAAISRRVKAVQKWRKARDRETTQKLAETPARFAEIRQPSTRFLAIPTTSSEVRRFIPIAYLDPQVIASNQVYVVANASLFDFAVLTSTMHMAWVRTVCGRLESRFRYSAGIVYNNFPWPTSVDAKRRLKVEACAKEVLEARAEFPDSTLAELYDPLAMPPRLVKAHAALDREVDLCYRSTKFQSDRERVEHLFALYSGLVAVEEPQPPRTRRNKKLPSSA